MVQPLQLHPSAPQAASNAMEMHRQQIHLGPSAVVAHNGHSNHSQLHNSQHVVRRDGYPYQTGVYYSATHTMIGQSQSTGHYHNSGNRHPFPPIEAYPDGSHRYIMKHEHYPPQLGDVVLSSKYNQSRQYPTVVLPHSENVSFESSQGRYRQTVEGHSLESTTRKEPNRLPPSNKHDSEVEILPSRRPPLMKTSVRSGEGRENRNFPFQTLVSNRGKMETPIAKKSEEKVKSLCQSNNDQENRGDVMNFIKSPVTMCFERMLGAAKYLANHPTPDNVKKQLARKSMGSLAEAKDEQESNTRKNMGSLIEPIYVQESRNKLKRKSIGDESVDSDTCLEGQSEHKRVRGLKPFLISTEEAEKLSKLGENNPFVQLLNDEDLYHQVILLMTLEAETKDLKKPTDPQDPISRVIGEGFKWRDYPQLEQILYDKMVQYYSISVSSRQSKQQQQFNNQMVASIRKAATASGCSFVHDFTDKKLRDRIRCFYKTHLQNAKKRLATMQKHPTSVINCSQVRLWIREAQQQMNFPELHLPARKSSTSET